MSDTITFLQLRDELDRLRGERSEKQLELALVRQHKSELLMRVAEVELEQSRLVLKCSDLDVTIADHSRTLHNLKQKKGSDE